MNITSESGGTVKYKFKVWKIPIKNKDFSIYAEGSDWRSDPDVFISTKPGTEPDLSENQTDTLACQRYGAEVCIMPLATLKENFKVDDYIFFDIKCWRKCSATFKVVFAEELAIDLGEELTYLMTDT